MDPSIIKLGLTLNSVDSLTSAPSGSSLRSMPLVPLLVGAPRNWVKLSPPEKGANFLSSAQLHSALMEPEPSSPHDVP